MRLKNACENSWRIGKQERRRPVPVEEWRRSAPPGHVQPISALPWFPAAVEVSLVWCAPLKGGSQSFMDCVEELLGRRPASIAASRMW